ncbi:MAG: S41 family peptidase [Thermotogota bacterium]|nr:S41 family peptidase [Thermotogota bacterium]
MKRNIIRISIVISLLMVVFALGAFKDLTDQEKRDKFEPVFEILNYIEDNYYDIDKVDYDNILNETLTGTMKGLDDPFAWYFTPRMTQENKIDTESKYGGIGAVVTYNSQYECLEVVSPMEGSPARKAGLKVGDLIVTIDGHDVAETGYYKSVDLLRGEPGTEVTVEVYRDNLEEPLIITIVRAKIEIKTVKYSQFDYEDAEIGYIRITQFSKPTYNEFARALREVVDSDGLIIDLRDNPGGLLNSVLNISSLLLPAGKTVITIEDRDGSKEIYRSWGSDAAKYLKDKPIVTLINEGSASGSEILTGALKDHSLATIIGTTTFGKAAVQTVYDVSNGSEIWLPTAHYLTPNGSDIHLKGILPDITVDTTETIIDSNEGMTTTEANIDFDKDIQLQKGLEVILEELK